MEFILREPIALITKLAPQHCFLPALLIKPNITKELDIIIFFQKVSAEGEEGD